MTDSARGSLARRYRPRRFADVTGQRHVAAVLRAAAERHEPPQQLLLAGESGLGKTTTARIFAAALFCTAPGPDGDACGACDECRDVASGAHPDVIEKDAASNGGVDEIRELIERATLAPMRAKWKVYIIDEAHGLTDKGGQAALKWVEEPPAHCIVVLATTDPQKLPTALRGRCQVLEVLRPTDAELTGNLHRVAAGEGWALSDRVAAAVLAATDPALGVRGTLMTLEKLTAPLTAGTDPDEELLATLLGVAPAGLVAALTTAIAGLDRPAAATALAALRARCSDPAIRAALTGWARAGYADSLRPGAPVAAELALWRYETLAAAPAGAVWTEIAVARLAAPRLEASPEALAALLAQAEHVIGRLTDAVRGTGTSGRSGPVAAPVAPAPAAAPVAPAPVAAPAEPPTAAPAPEEKAATPPRTRAATPAAPAAPAVPATPTPAEAAPAGNPVAAFGTAVAAASRIAAAQLRNCAVTVDGADLVLTVPPALTPRVSAQLELLTELAGELGFGLRLAS